MLSYCRVFLLIMLVTAAASQQAAAQIFRGTVRDTLGAPLHDVRVTLLTGKSDSVLSEARTGNAGDFMLSAPRAGKYRVRLNRIGFAQQTSAVIDVATEVVTLRFTMVATMQQLAPVTVVDRRRPSLIELMSANGFDMRNEKYPMRTLDQEELSWEGATTVEDLLATGTLAWVNVITTRNGALSFTMKRQGRPGDCAPQLFLDGFPALNADVLGHYGADMLYGLEVYRGSQVPPPSLGGEFGGGISPCGVIAVWTKNGRERDVVAARAKVDGPVQVIRGTVMDFSSGKPVSNAELVLRSDFGRTLEKSVRTDSTGTFNVHTKHYENLRLFVTASGYMELLTPRFFVDAEEVVTVEVIVASSKLPAAPLALKARELERNYVVTDRLGFGFRKRRALSGTFFDSSAVARSVDRSLADLLRQIVNVNVSPGPRADAITFNVEQPAPAARSNQKNAPSPSPPVRPATCNPILFVNGELQPDAESALAALQLSQLAAIEVFPLASEVPYVYRIGGVGCGVIGVWRL